MLRSVPDLVGDPEIAELETGRLAVAELHRLLEMRWQHLVEVDQPLVLISQVGRSGGTLLARLLDGHRSLHVHPYELHLGHPDKIRWPRVDPRGDPAELYEALREPQTERLFWQGYHKQGLPLGGVRPALDELTPFAMLPSLERRIFHRLVARACDVETRRDVLDCFMTALFNSWLDYAGLRTGPKRWVVAYAPMVGWGEERQEFFADYPDGRLVAVLRDPESWWASARLYDPVTYGDLEFALEIWRHSATEMMEARRERPEATIVVRFERLVAETRPTMRALASELGIRYGAGLATPTLNLMPVSANSSFGTRSRGLDSSAASRADELSEAERIRIRRATAQLLRTARDQALPAG